MANNTEKLNVRRLMRICKKSTKPVTVAKIDKLNSGEIRVYFNPGFIIEYVDMSKPEFELFTKKMAIYEKQK